MQTKETKFVVGCETYSFFRHLRRVEDSSGCNVSRLRPKTLREAKRLAESHQDRLYATWACRRGYDCP